MEEADNETNQPTLRRTRSLSARSIQLNLFISFINFIELPLRELRELSIK